MNKTGNPVGSKAFLDFEDNVKNLDQAVNSDQDTFQDRLGRSRLTWAGVVKAGTGDPGEIVRIVNDAVADVVEGVDGQVAVAEAAADRAEAAATAARASGSYTSIANGLAGTNPGDIFLVAGSDPYTYGVYANVGGTAEPRGVANFANQQDVKDLIDDNYGKSWRSPQSADLTTAGERDFCNAVKKIVGTGFTTEDRALEVVFGIGFKNDATNLDRMTVYVRGQATQSWGYYGATDNKDDGPVWIKLEPGVNNPSKGVFWVLIDYRGLSDGLIVNNINGSKMLFDESVYALEEPGAVKPPFANPPWRDAALSDDGETLPDDRAEIAEAIQVIDAEGLPKTGEYRITIFCKNSPVFGDRIAIQDQNGDMWYNGSPNIPNKSVGPVWTTLTSTTGKPGSINLLVDYRKISEDGIVMSHAASRQFVLNSTIFFGDEIREQIVPPAPPVPGGNTSDTLPRAIRVAMAGSSITWGSGWLGQLSLVGTVDDYLRYRFATTLHGTAFTTSGSVTTETSPLFFRGSASRLSGAGASASFALEGDEVSLCIARPRGSMGAALVDVYIDGALYDTFDTTGNPVQSLSSSFVGDGTSVKFDLGQAFTFGHSLSVDGVAQTVVMNTGGFGSTIPANADAMVIRRVSDATGDVTHWLFFKVAPASGADIVCNFQQGESVTYMKGTVGQIAEALNSQNESPYGDGVTSYDPALPASLSSGLGFRYTDERSVVSWHFADSATRQVEVRVRESAPGATGTPELWLNFATNRMHRIMNAGIGGFDAGELLNDGGVNGIEKVIEFQPDVVMFEFCTNDDWKTHVHKAWNVRPGLTAAQVRDVETANYYASVTKQAEDSYTVHDVRLTVTEMLPRKAVVAPGSEFNIEAGDVVVFGEFFGDNRRLVSRVITSWDETTRTISWGRPVSDHEVAGVDSIDELSVCRVFGAPLWVDWMNGLVSEVRSALPSALVGIGTSGIPNIRHRRLEGYRELGASIAEQTDSAFIDYYRATLDWQYSQKPTAALFLNDSQSTISTGAASYVLYQGSGMKPDPLATAGWNLRGWSVMVDGVERINKGCHIYGGGKRGWPDEVDPATTLSNGVQAGDDYQVVFTEDVPPAGAEIVIHRVLTKWATDDCHPGAEGRQVMGQAACCALRGLAIEATKTMGASV